VIAPPWWRSTVVYILIGVFLIIVIVVYIKLREKSLIASKLALEKIVKDRTEEVMRQKGELEQQNEELIQGQEEISTQRDMVAAQNKTLQNARDIIERQNEEIKLRNETLEAEVEKRTKELIDYTQQLEQFAFISAHNLRAPVARILGLGQLIDLQVEDKHLVYEKLVMTTRELDRVVRDLNTILEIKKNNSSIVTEVNLEEEFQSVKINLEKEISDTQAVIETDFSSVNIIRAVKPYLDSILLNLVGNAIKYRKPLRPPLITLRSELREDDVRLIVSDNGLGINLSLYRDKIFTLYKRFHSHVEGKGLGLYLVKTQVTAMGGTIDVESETDKGTIFYISIPRRNSDE
jgi:signal transduction histidine kinase